MNKKISKILLFLILVLIASVFVACSGDTPSMPENQGNPDNTENGSNSSKFYGTWKSTQVLQFSPDMTTLFNDYMYLSFSDSSLVVYIPSKGSSKSLDYSYSAMSAETGTLTITENGTPHTVYVLISGDTYTFTGTGFSELEISKGAPGAIQITKTSSSLDYTPEMKPDSGSDNNNGNQSAKQYTVTIVVDGYTFPSGYDYVTTQFDEGTLFDSSTLPPEETGLTFEDGAKTEWYTDNAGTPFSGTLNANTTLYLKWTGGVTTGDYYNKTYLVMDSTGLQAWASASNNNSYSIDCTLLADIELPYTTSSEGNWKTPFIGEFNAFEGTFDGNGHGISNMQNIMDAHGFIGAVAFNGVVKNLTLKNATIEGTDIGTIASVSSGTIENCTVSGTVNSTQDAGGLVSFNKGTIKDSSFTGTVYSRGNGGGIAGTSFGKIEGCIVKANVYTHEDNNKDNVAIGGIAGYTYYNYIIGCYSSGKVVNQSRINNIYYIGGIVGNLTENSYVVACASECTIEYQYYSNPTKPTAGGVVGYSSASEIRACSFFGIYNSGNSLVGEGRNATKAINNVSSVGYPGITVNRVSSDSTNKPNGKVGPKYDWYEGVSQLNKEIDSWNSSHYADRCNYKYRATGSYSNPALIPTE